MRQHLSRPVIRGVSVGLTMLLAAGGQLVLASAAQAATVILNVTTTSDIPAVAGACGSLSVAVPSPLSLREATCIANNWTAASPGSAVTINVPSGTYNLVSGELSPGLNTTTRLTIQGGGAASTVLNGGGLSRVLNIDSMSVGDVSVSLSDLTITGGDDDTFGGAGILAGSGPASVGDVLTIVNTVFTDNHVTTADPNRYGGALEFQGGRLAITDSTFTGNSSGASVGGAVMFGAQDSAPGESLTITGTTFSGNSETASVAGLPNGGALAVSTVNPGVPMTVSNSRFVNNTTSATTGTAVGAAIYQQSGALTVSGSTFTGNGVGSGAGARGGAVYIENGTAALHYNRFTGNIATAGSAISRGVAAGAVDATENWWGCNTGPGTAGCDTVNGPVTVAPRLVLTAAASPSTVVGPNGASTITAGLTVDSLGSAVNGALLTAFTGLPIGWQDPQPAGATVSAASTPVSAGQANVTFSSQAATGPGHVLAGLDNALVSAALTVNRAPAITSANAITFGIGVAGSFTVTTTGFPTAAISRTGSLPAGISFTDNGNGTATLAGTPAAGSGGSYPLALTAANGVAPNGTQTLTLTVNQAPTFTSPASATFTAGTAGSFTVTTSAAPVAAVQLASGTLPGGLTFVDNGNGTATLAGTPAPGSGGTYALSLSATNGVNPAGTQGLTVTVRSAPAITSNPNSQVVNPGTPVTFTATADGFPVPTVQWQRSVNGGASYTNIAGATSTSYTFTTAAGDNGNRYRAVFTNTVSSATSTSALLSVGTAPAFSSSNTATFRVGTAGSFTVTTTGPPQPAIAATGQPAWLSVTDNGDGTAAIAGTPPAGSGGLHDISLTADNGFAPPATQTFTLRVDQSPAFTSATSATFIKNTAGSFVVTAAAGFPAATTLARTGALPAGVTFTDNGDGTAALAGTPTVGGSFPLTFTATATGGTAPAATQSFTLTVDAPPVITSADSATFRVGTPGTFTVTTTPGTPAPRTVTVTGTLPTGVSRTDNGNGTATLTGTPAPGSGGVYGLTITASNGVGPDAVQAFTLTVEEPPAITSASQATFTLGAAALFTVTTTPGQSASPVSIGVTGTLPDGITFTDNGDGTASFSGTPAEGGVFPVTLSASNGIAPDTTQDLTLTVNAAPVITSADNATFSVGTAGTFTVTTTPGTPAGVAITATGTLPSGVSLSDDGNGTATLAGTPATGAGGSYVLTIEAANPVPQSSSQTFTLTVNEPPAFASTDQVTFTLGTSGTFTVTTVPGVPVALSLTESGALPAGVTFTDNGDGTAGLAGTPSVGGVYPLTLTASNGVLPDASQAFTLTVDSAPVFTSTGSATFDVGSSETFTVTTTPGTPSDVTITETGVLPSGVTLADNGDGTATLSGTAATSSGGSYPLTLVAANSSGQSSSQPFTLTVDELPAFTSAAATIFTVGTAGSFTMTTTAGYPIDGTLTAVGTLPAGVSITDNGDGTATLAGDPATGTGGAYALSLQATNASGMTVQEFVLTVEEPPTVTSAAATTFTAGTAGTFTVTTSGGFPTPPGLSVDGALPAEVSFVDNLDGTATLSGTPTSGGTYAVTITADNGVAGAATQAFTLTVNGPPAITSDAAVTFTAGVVERFDVTTQAGVPAATTLTVAGALPAGVTFIDNGDGTATLAGTAAPSAVGDYPLTVTASNGVDPDANQELVLTVTPAPTVLLPAELPPSNGQLVGVPPVVTVGDVLHVSGSGFAAGAPITIGSYPGGAAFGSAVADGLGNFTATVTVPSTLGDRTFVAAGIGPDGDARYLIAGVTVLAPPVVAPPVLPGQPVSPPAAVGPGTAAGSGGPTPRLPFSGTAMDPARTVGYALLIMLAGVGLAFGARRRDGS